MASDSLRQVGRGLKQTNRRADLALKRVTNDIPKKERTRDTMSSLFPFTMYVSSEGKGDKFTLNINFNKPPPSDCAAECIATACEDFELSQGSYLLQTTNPYEPGTVRVYSQGETIDPAQFTEENPAAGQVYVQVQPGVAMIVICYSYIIC